MTTATEINLSISELEKQIANDSECATAMRAKADEIDTNVQAMTDQIATLTAQLEALDSDAGDGAV